MYIMHIFLNNALTQMLKGQFTALSMHFALPSPFVQIRLIRVNISKYSSTI